MISQESRPHAANMQRNRPICTSWKQERHHSLCDLVDDAPEIGGEDRDSKGEEGGGGEGGGCRCNAGVVWDQSKKGL